LLVHDGFSCFGELCSLHRAKREQAAETENRAERCGRASVARAAVESATGVGGRSAARANGKGPIAERTKSK